MNELRDLLKLFFGEPPDQLRSPLESLRVNREVWFSHLIYDLIPDLFHWLWDGWQMWAFALVFGLMLGGMYAGLLHGGKSIQPAELYLLAGYLAPLFMAWYWITEERKRRYKQALQKRYFEDLDEFRTWNEIGSFDDLDEADQAACTELPSAPYGFAADRYVNSDIGRQYELKFRLLSGIPYGQMIMKEIVSHSYLTEYNPDNLPPPSDGFWHGEYGPTYLQVVGKATRDLDKYLARRMAKPKQIVPYEACFFDHGNARLAFVAMTCLSVICAAVLFNVGQTTVRLHTYSGVRALVGAGAVYAAITFWRWRFALPGSVAGLCTAVCGAVFVYGGLHRSEWLRADFIGALVFSFCAVFGFVQAITPSGKKLRSE